MFFVWNVFIQIEAVALKAVGLPEEGTLRIGGRRVRLRPFPPCHPKMRTIKYGPESQAQGRISPQKACSIRSNGKTPRREVVAGPGRSPRTSYYTGDRGFPPTRLYPPSRGGYRGQEEAGGAGRKTRRRPKRAGGSPRTRPVEARADDRR